MLALAQLLMVCAPLEIMRSNIISIGLRYKKPKDRARPLPSMLSLFEQIVAAVASSPLGTGRTIQQPGRELTLISPLRLIISNSYVIADGDHMGVSEYLTHCH